MPPTEPHSDEVERQPRPISEHCAQPRLWSWRSPWGAFAVVLACVASGVALGFLGRSWLTRPSSPDTIAVRSTPGVLVAVRELARLETTELRIEKVIDLTDQQSRMYGIIQGTDAILLVAAGNATLGIDLGDVCQGDVTTSADGKSATLRLPEPKLLQVGLDENATYVYTRTTSLLARRNEQLESKARREAVEAIRKEALTRDMVARAKAQAERQLRSLLAPFGVQYLEIAWHP